MRHLLARAPLVVALAWPLASSSACFNDVGGVTSATSGGSDGSAGSSTAAGSTGGATTSGSSSGASTGAAATAVETSAAETSTGTAGETTSMPDLCRPDVDAEPCESCVASACCDPFVACAEDEGCMCFVNCLGLGNDGPTCGDECNVDPQTGVIGVLIACTVLFCNMECNVGP